jgi:hypothetical protein
MRPREAVAIFALSAGVLAPLTAESVYAAPSETNAASVGNIAVGGYDPNNPCDLTIEENKGTEWLVRVSGQTVEAILKENHIKDVNNLMQKDRHVDTCINDINDLDKSSSTSTTTTTPATTPVSAPANTSGVYYGVSQLQAQTNRLLAPYGMSNILVDGKYGEQTKRAICTAEWLLGLAQVTRTKITGDSATAASIMSATSIGVPLASKGKAGKWADVSNICQSSVFGTDDQVNYVFISSTGGPGLETPAGNYVTYKYDPALLTAQEKANKNNKRRSGWHDSIDSPSPSGLGNMYRPFYIKRTKKGSPDGGMAFHGADNVPTYPASHKCVRLRSSDMDKVILWAGLDSQTELTRKVLAMSVVIEGKYEG